MSVCKYVFDQRKLEKPGNQKELRGIEDEKEQTFNQLPPSGIKLRPRIPCKDIAVDVAP